MSQSTLPLFSSGSFFVLGLKSLIHIWVYFCIWCENVIWFDSFACSYLAFPASFIEETSFTPLYILAFYVIH